jgi:zinc transport system ATP-binding protein
MSSSNSPLLEAINVTLRDGNKLLLDNISLTINPGQIITVIGPNGAGKTSLLNVLLGLKSPSSGKVISQSDLRIGYMPQRLLLNPLLPLNVHRFLKLVHHSLVGIENALERTGVSHLLTTDMQSLSGGELQRVLLARALLRKPQLLVLDEPVQGVDVGGQSQLYQLISQLRNELGCGVLMVSHDLHLVMAATDHVICLNQHVCCHGHPEKISSHPEYISLFGETATQFATYTHHHDHNHNLHGEVVHDCHSEHRQ